MQVLEREGMSRECADYLERVGGEQVIQRLEALIRQSGPRKEERQAEGSETKGARAGSKLRRREVEDLIRAIRLRPFAGE
jgi:hypothetical protein